LTPRLAGICFCEMLRRSIHLCGQEIEQPGHICAFFASRDEEYEALIPYFRDGVTQGEQVLNVLDADRLDDHRARLAMAGLVPNDPGFAISSSEETYLAGGRFDMGRMVAFVADHLAQRGQMVVDIMATHPYVILKGRIRENPFFIPPTVYLKELLSAKNSEVARVADA